METVDLILTATATQARFLRDRWAAEQIAAGVTAWETPPILSLQAWMRQQWGQLQQGGAELPLLLSPDQERVVWKQSLSTQLLAPQALLRQGDLVTHAVRANRLFHHWGEEGESFQSLLSDTHLEEVELFAAWQQRFEARCQRELWLEGARLAGHFRQLLLEGAVTPPTQFSHYHYSSWSRAEQRLVEVLEAQGSCGSAYQIPPLAAVPTALVAPDPVAELQWVAAAVGEQLQKAPNTRIGIVVPELKTRREQMDRCFRHQLLPQSDVEAIVEEQLPYRFSQGRALMEDPRIHHALQLLRLKQQKLPLLELSLLLRSPWLLLGAEMEARSRIDLQLRAMGLLEVSLEQLLRLFQSGSEATVLVAPRFQGALQALLDLELSSRRSLLQWSESFTRALALFEWAENGEQSVVAFNAYNGWREGMDRFIALSDLLGGLSADEALSELRQVLSGVALEVGRSERPIEIMSLDEAYGIQFDALWVLSCEDTVWPRQQPLTPFLPQQWQRARVPGVDHVSAQQMSRTTFSLQKGAAAQVCFSCSESEAVGGEVMRGLTPLLGQLPLQHYRAAEEMAWWQQPPLVLEQIEDQRVELEHGSTVRGGSTVLANQSQCPFRAYVRHRLQAVPIEHPQSGLDARERGTLLHLLLQRCWHELGKNAKQLQQMGDSQLRKMVEKIAAGTVARLRDERQDRFGPRFAQNEWQRLAALTLRALELDRQREEPFEVEEMEEKHNIELGGVRLSIKMDRVDRLSDGRRVLIDYKSGKVNRADWQGERPVAPQLPLYTILLSEVSAVLYSQIRADEVLYRGEQESESVMAGAVAGGRSPSVVCSEAWLAQLQQWHGVVEALAVEFRTGVATVDPQQGANSCLYCGLQALCRLEL